MGQQLKALAALTEDLGSVLNTHTKKLTTIYNSRSRGSNALLWPSQALHTNGVYTYTQAKHSNT